MYDWGPYPYVGNQVIQSPHELDESTGRFGGEWAEHYYQRHRKWCEIFYDDVFWHWDYAWVKWYYREYHPMGVATSPIYQLGDLDHTYKQVQQITYTGSRPADSTIELEFKIDTPSGWTDWLPAENATEIDLVASHIQVRLTLSPDLAYKQQTPRVDLVRVEYGDPPPGFEVTPLISNVQQSPLEDCTGYQDPVNVTCQVETYTLLSRVTINYTISDWDTFSLVNMTDHFGYGKAQYWGVIPPQTFGTTVKYKIFAENFWGNSTAEEFNYVVIDNVPPHIDHVNSSNWVAPLHPRPVTDSSVRIECRASDDITTIDIVVLYATQANMTSSHLMSYDSDSDRYYHDLEIGIISGGIEYYITAMDTYGNTQCTPNFTIILDTVPPTIESWTTPDNPEYDEVVWIYANVTDWNAVVSVSIKWSLDWVTNNTDRSMHKIASTLWRVDTPLPNFPYNTTVRWELIATDECGWSRTRHFSYFVNDTTPPSITNIHYITPAQEGFAFPINVTVEEPIGASGVNPTQAYILYILKTEGYSTTHYVKLVQTAPNTWSGVIPAQPFNQTVYFQISIKDRAGNTVVSATYMYVVVKRAELINWMNFGWWVLIMVVILAALVIYRKNSRQAKLAGNKFLAVGVIIQIGVTVVLWLGPLSWWELKNLSFQEWMLQAGTSTNWLFLLLLLFLMFFTIGGSFGALYSADRRKAEKEKIVFQTPSRSFALRQIAQVEADLKYLIDE